MATMDRKEEVRISKLLSYILRHGAVKEKLAIERDGYIKLSDLLARPKLKGVTEAQIQYIVANNDKQRFFLKQDHGDWYIRANQGHSLRQLDSVDMTPQQTPLDTVIHGTTLANWHLIQQSGYISRMNRNHIHCAIGLPEDNGVISGIRSSSQVLIYIDMQKALQDGILFYRSANDVILTDGLDGSLSLKYVSQVVDRDGKSLL
ncbi:phosphotransferase KptA/Tpt1 [Halteromyces radiatus]|uniref:phosphotransferase KptA/Tpt1 n=1 Tax=Halteromyces radiatus TaxID=101107 RepID=UPI002220AA8A|nr:phosphotransferase KptA/Tpt1 [Halteromyces radiatus]KAI8085026.1 phosphotransferase KptA/Tpt1 [Halteromyces radiatus]